MTDQYEGVPPPGVGGSYSQDDPDRPRWDRETKLIAEYDYHRPDGTYSFTARKGIKPCGEKTFTLGRHNTTALDERWDAESRKDWISGMGGEQHTLFHLPQLLGASPGEPIYIVEGEKDATSLIDLGLIATTNSSGAGKWREEFSEHLAGREVVILPDNDEVGRAHAAKVLRSVSAHARSVRVIELAGLPKKGDVTDWIEAGGDKAALLKLVDEAPPVADPNALAIALGQFSTDENGKPHRSQKNARVALRKMGVTVSYDAFARRHLISGLADFGPLLDDAALTRMRLRVEEEFNLFFGKDKWFEIVTNEARKASFHPVREYLDRVEWDGVSRVLGWLSQYAGAEDSEYVRAVGQLVLVAAVRRVRQPGCKFDEMVVLESQQGTNKSSALAVLAVREEWFADDLPLNADSKVVIEQVSGRWLVELAEMKGMRRGEIESVKSMLSRRVDKARLAYGRMPVEQPRECIFFGTTNDRQYLRDMTGNRRFWPVAIQKFDLKALRRDRDQLWAEAAHLEADGAAIRLPEKLWKEAGLEQDARQIGDPFFEVLAPLLDGAEGKLAGSDVWFALGLSDPSRRTPDHNVRLSAVMQALGWERPKGKLRIRGKPQHAWVKGDPQPSGIYPDAEVKSGEL